MACAPIGATTRAKTSSASVNHRPSIVIELDLIELDALDLDHFATPLRPPPQRRTHPDPAHAGAAFQPDATARRCSRGRGAYLRAMDTSTKRHGRLREQLSAEHGELAGAFRELENASESGDPKTVLAAFRELDALLREHMDHEDEALLPALASRHPDEVRAIERQHAELRARLDELGVAAELHTLRDVQLRELIGLLEAHARREEEGLYRFADAELDAPARKAVASRALSRARALAGRIYGA